MQFVFKMINKKAATPISTYLLVIGTFVLMGVAWYIFSVGFGTAKISFDEVNLVSELKIVQKQVEFLVVNQGRNLQDVIVDINNIFLKEREYNSFIFKRIHETTGGNVMVIIEKKNNKGNIVSSFKYLFNPRGYS